MMNAEQLAIQISDVKTYAAQHGRIAVRLIRQVQKDAADSSPLSKSRVIVASRSARAWAQDAARFARYALSLEEQTPKE